ncbi:MAG: hypothetical protein ACRD1C_08620 [Terriglobales bacterium]
MGARYRNLLEVLGSIEALATVTMPRPARLAEVRNAIRTANHEVKTRERETLVALMKLQGAQIKLLAVREAEREASL